MAIPLLGYPLNTQNGRVSNLAGDNSTVQSQLYPSSAAGDDTNRSDMDAVIEQATAKSSSMRCAVIANRSWNHNSAAATSR